MAHTRPLTSALTIEMKPPGILLLRWAEGAVSEQDWRRHLEAWRDRSEKGSSFVLLSDVRRTVPISATRRKEVSDFIDQRRETLARCQKGAALVVANGLQRGVITAMLWLANPPFPVKVFTDDAAARDWCRQQLA